MYKSKTTAAILSFFLGGLGIDRFYLGYTGLGILKLLTLGVFGILALIDFIRILTGSLKPADGSPYQEQVDREQMQKVMAKAAHADTVRNASSAADELKKYKELLNQGVISEQEFQAKKEQLLKLV